MTRMNFDKTNKRKRLVEARTKAPDHRFDHLSKPPGLPKGGSTPPGILSSVTKEPHTITSEVMTITPELATQWLEGNIHNRTLRQKDIELYAAAMKSGRWVLNGESIIFADDETLMDGQHRLWGCVESRVPFQSIVVFGAPRKAFTTIDQGRHRSTADHLKVSGLEAPNLMGVGAVASDILRYRSNNIFSNLKNNPEDIIALVKAEPGIVEWANKAKRAPTGLKGFSTPIAVTLYLGSRGLSADAETFMHQWATGADLAAGSPVLTLRQRVLTAKPSVRWERLFLVVSAWNAFAQKRPLFKMGSLRGDKFPAIVGDV